MECKPTKKITCAILCYNYGQYLNQAIDSCLNQTLDNSLYEILVIDDGSTDNTPEVCASYGDKIHVSRSENLGFTKSLERALLEANGEYVAFLDADDWWEPSKLISVYNVLEVGIYAVIHPMYEVDKYGEFLNNIGACGNTSSVCVHREAGISLMPSTSEIFAQVFIKIGQGIILKNILANYRIHEKSMTDRSANSKHTEFFADTNRILAINLHKMLSSLPFWVSNRKILENTANFYFSESQIKNFQRTTELRTTTFKDLTLVVISMFRAKRLPKMREFRFFARYLFQKTGLK